MLFKKKNVIKTYRKGLTVGVRDIYTDVVASGTRISMYIIDMSLYDNKGNSYYLLSPKEKGYEQRWVHKDDILLVGESKDG